MNYHNQNTTEGRARIEFTLTSYSLETAPLTSHTVKKKCFRVPKASCLFPSFVFISCLNGCGIHIYRYFIGNNKQQFLSKHFWVNRIYEAHYMDVYIYNNTFFSKIYETLFQGSCAIYFLVVCFRTF